MASQYCSLAERQLFPAVASHVLTNGFGAGCGGFLEGQSVMYNLLSDCKDQKEYIFDDFNDQISFLAADNKHFDVQHTQSNSPVQSDEWISLSPTSVEEYLPHNEAHVYSENTFNQANDLGQDFDIFTEFPGVEDVLDDMRIDDISLPKQHNEEVYALTDSYQTPECTGSLNLSHNPSLTQSSNVYLIVPNNTMIQNQPPCFEGQSRKRKRKNSHSQIRNDNDIYSIDIDGFKEDVNSVKFTDTIAEVCNVDDSTINESFFDLICSDDVSLSIDDIESVVGNDLEGFFPNDADKYDSTSTEAERKERKRALNRDAAHRYRKKQKTRQSKETDMYKNALRALQKAERVYMNKRQSLTVLQSVVIDLLRHSDS